jgi:K+-sensing histidine kinase KdpD
MRVGKGMLPIAVSLCLVAAVTAVMWRLNSTAAGSYHLVYIYLFPVALIAALYNGRLALLSTAVALICADFFLQKPLYILGNDNPLEYGDLFVFAVLAVTAIKFVRVLTGPRVSSLAVKRPPSQHGAKLADRSSTDHGGGKRREDITRSFDAVGKCPPRARRFRASLRAMGRPSCTFLRTLSTTSHSAF